MRGAKSQHCFDLGQSRSSGQTQALGETVLFPSPLPPILPNRSATRDRGLFLSGDGVKEWGCYAPSWPGAAQVSRVQGGGAGCRGGVRPRPPTHPLADMHSLPLLRGSPRLLRVMGTSQGVSGGPRLRTPPATPPTPEPTCSWAAPSGPPMMLTYPGSSPRVPAPRDPRPQDLSFGQGADSLQVRPVLTVPPTPPQTGGRAGQW